MRSALIVSNGTPHARCVCAYRSRCSKSQLLAARLHRFFWQEYAQFYELCFYCLKLLKEEKYTFCDDK